MKRGDLVQYEGSFWIVHVYDPKLLRIAKLLQANGTVLEIAHDLDKRDPSCKVLANPALEWPFLMVPAAPRWGQVVNVHRLVRGTLIRLEPFNDWVLSEPVRSGGSLFLSPGMNLLLGEVVQVEWGQGQRRNISIQAGFGSVKERKARVALAAKPEPASGLSRLLGDNELDK